MLNFPAFFPSSPLHADAQVKISYVARLPDGTVFDERAPDNPLEFTTEEGEPGSRTLHPGSYWDLSLQNTNTKNSLLLA